DTATTEISTLSLHDALPIWFGFIGIVAWGWFQSQAATSARHNLERFAVERAVAQQSGLPIDRSPDQLLWSPTRISAWRGAIAEPGPAPLAVLRIPKVRLEAAVLPGTDDRTLDRGLGHIENTS